MPLNPPPTIDANLALVVQPLIRNDMTRKALLTFALHTTNPPSSADAQATINGFQTHFNARIAPILDDDVTVLQPTIRLGDGGTTPFEAVAAGASVAGGSTDHTPPPNVALLIKKSTGLGGKQNRGRTYLPWAIDDANVGENGSVNPASIAILQPPLTNFLSDLNAANYPMCIAHKVFNVPLPPHHVVRLQLGPVVTSYVLEPLVASQRRRVGRSS